MPGVPGVPAQRRKLVVSPDSTPELINDEFYTQIKCKKEGFNQPAYQEGKNTDSENNKFLIPDDGILLSSGDPTDISESSPNHPGTNHFVGGDEELTDYLNVTTYDACYIEFEFRCKPNEYIEAGTPAQVSFNYQFVSQEYFDGSSFHDAFAFFFNHENVGLLPDGTVVSMNNVNEEYNSDFFIGNEDFTEDGFEFPGIQGNGFTTILTATHEAVVGEWNTLKLVVADVGDHWLDSWILLEAGSFQCVEKVDDEFPTIYPTVFPTVIPTGCNDTTPENVSLYRVIFPFS